MIRAAFNVSAAHRMSFDEFLGAIERGREPSEEAVAKLASQHLLGAAVGLLNALWTCSWTPVGPDRTWMGL